MSPPASHVVPAPKHARVGIEASQPVYSGHTAQSGSNCRGLRARSKTMSGLFPLTFRHEAVLRRALEWLAIRANCLRFARLALALRHKAIFRGARERLAVFADRFAFARSLCCCRADCER